MSTAFETFKHKTKLLWGDDDNEYQERMKYRFEQLGFQVSLCSEKKDCFDKFKKENPDVVLLDLNWGKSLHDYTGIEIESKLRRIDPSIATIAFSAYIKQPDYKKKLAEESRFDFKINKSDIECEQSDVILGESAKLSMIRKGIIDFKNLPLDIFKYLSIKLKREIAKKIYENNRDKLKTLFKNHEWAVISANDIIKAGRELLNYQDKQALEEWRRKLENDTQLPTFYFLRPPIVESINWRPTRGDDFYPNIELVIDDKNTSFMIQGDFDTGSDRTFISDVFFPEDDDTDYDVSEGFFEGPYNFIEKTLLVSLRPKKKERKVLISSPMNISVVEGWEKSGFINNYPQRELLIGRDIMKVFPSIFFILNWNKKKTILLVEED